MVQVNTKNQFRNAHKKFDDLGKKSKDKIIIINKTEYNINFRILYRKLIF